VRNGPALDAAIRLRLDGSSSKLGHAGICLRQGVGHGQGQRQGQATHAVEWVARTDHVHGFSLGFGCVEAAECGGRRGAWLIYRLSISSCRARPASDEATWASSF